MRAVIYSRLKLAGGTSLQSKQQGDVSVRVYVIHTNKDLLVFTALVTATI